jgi:hypothetical protein
MTSSLIEYLGSDADKLLFDTEKGKEYMRVDFIHEDELINGQIRSATQSCENYTKRAFLLQKRKTTFRYIPESSLFVEGVQVHFSPVQSIESLKLVAKGVAVETLIQGTHYWITDGKLFADLDLIGPIARDKTASHFELEYTAGMAKSAFIEAYPAIVEAVKMVLHNAWDGRGFNSVDIPPNAKQKLSPYRNLVCLDV